VLQASSLHGTVLCAPQNGAPLPAGWNARSIPDGAAEPLDGTRLADRARMSTRIRVADARDLPPGKGRVVEVGGRQFTVFNRDGRFYATTSHAPAWRTLLAGDTSDTCAQRGLEFEVWMEDSPARLNDEGRCLVRIDDEGVWLIVG
jgi:hypothetical protein